MQFAREGKPHTLSSSDRSDSGIQIRTYHPSDYKECRMVFTEGMQELINLVSHVVFPRFLKYIAMATVIAILLSIRWSIWFLVFDFFVSILVIALLYIDIYIESWKFINGCLATDLMDIDKSYMSSEGCRMWVAEWHGKVVGMVGLIQNEHHKPGFVELQRMSVLSTCRKMGIAKKLLDAAVEYAREQKLQAIILSTTSAQTPAIRFYKKYGFRMFDVYPYPQWILGDLEYWCFDLHL